MKRAFGWKALFEEQVTASLAGWAIRRVLQYFSINASYERIGNVLSIPSVRSGERGCGTYLGRHGIKFFLWSGRRNGLEIGFLFYSSKMKNPRLGTALE